MTLDKNAPKVCEVFFTAVEAMLKDIKCNMLHMRYWMEDNTGAGPIDQAAIKTLIFNTEFRMEMAAHPTTTMEGLHAGVKEISLRISRLQVYYNSHIDALTTCYPDASEFLNYKISKDLLDKVLRAGSFAIDYIECEIILEDLEKQQTSRKWWTTVFGVVAIVAIVAIAATAGASRHH